MIRRPPRSTLSSSSAASDVYKRQVYLFMISDMSVKLVADNSHSEKPWLYKFSGSWGNHEGSMLLWVAILSLSGSGIALLERRVRRDTLIATLMAQGLIALGFYAFLLFSSNPFARLNPAPSDGNGLNPLLQDPGLALHPPTLYLGYVCLLYTSPSPRDRQKSRMPSSA